MSGARDRDILMQDFAEDSVVDFPAEGSPTTPNPPTLGSYKFKEYAPHAFATSAEFGISLETSW